MSSSLDAVPSVRTSWNPF